MLTEKLIPRLREQFPNRNVRFGVPPEPAAIFPAIHPVVGDVEIVDDGDELTLIAGNFTHGHFSNYDASLSLSEKEQQIVESVIDFLERLFDDQIVMYGSHHGGGGWYRREGNAISEPGGSLYVWSGPISAVT